MRTGNALAGTGSLARLAVRRDRVLLPVWTWILVLTAWSTVSTLETLYPTVASRVQAAASNNGTTAIVAMYGRVYDPTALGNTQSMLKANVFGTLLVAILTILIVVRHTRTEEETGRLELLGATVVGRYAALTAGLAVAVAADAAIGTLVALVYMGGGLPVAGSLVAGLAWAAVGMAFAAITAVVVQLTQSGRTAIGVSSAVLGAVYVIRAIGDTSDAGGPRWLSWLSPIGWGQQFRPYAGNRWWVLLITLAFAAVLTVGAYLLVARRDLGAGLLPDRPGPAGSAVLRSPLALAWRLQRGMLIGWVAGALILGLALGGIASNIGDMANSEGARELFVKLGGTQGLTDAFLAAEFGFIGIFISVYGVQAVMRLRSEETALRAEPLLATRVGRIRWALSHITIALAGTTLIVVGGGLSAGLSYGATVDDMGQIGRLMGAALVQLPAAWLLTGIVVAAFGLAPRLIVAGWAALVAFLLLGELGPVFDLSQPVMDISPYAHVPKLPAAGVSVTPLVWLLAIAVALTAAGLAGFRRRDIG
ncbi:MAG TPA: ABC transporter permease [Streptosporangiaceae bacterium]|nr:ABC transporter permease [Streptosporangiaceae bacterium]